MTTGAAATGAAVTGDKGAFEATYDTTGEETIADV
jgi:hypothetical protein